MTLTIHELAIRKVMTRRGDDLNTKGINVFLKELDEKCELGMGEEDFFTRRPDAWSYEPSGREEIGIPGTLNIFEIEDSHMISLDKMRDYADLWFNLDDLDLDLKLFVYDRYGEHERQICLCEYWFMFLRDDIGLPHEKLGHSA